MVGTKSQFDPGRHRHVAGLVRWEAACHARYTGRQGAAMRFTIRDLRWLTVVVALGVAWWVRERQLQAELTRIQAHLNEQTMRAVSKAKTVENLTKMLESMGWTVD